LPYESDRWPSLNSRRCEISRKKFGGEGILLAGVPGTPKANVVIFGGGTVGMNACKIAVGMGLYVTILDINLKRLRNWITCSERISRRW
jgi:alanine dehydrogenase